MTTNLETLNSQREIKHILKVLEWSYNDFSGKYLIETSNFDVEEHDIKTLAEKIKKQLSRKTTKPEIIHKYIAFIKETSEYKKNVDISPDIFKTIEMEGFIEDYQLIINDEENEENKRVLKVAAAYALSIGSAWDFNVVPIPSEGYGKKFLVIWEGDVGNSGGSGTWGPVMCEVSEGNWGRLFVEKSDRFFETSLRCIEDVIGYFNEELLLTGYRYDDHDSNNHPSLKYSISLKKSAEGKWYVEREEFIEKRGY